MMSAEFCPLVLSDYKDMGRASVRWRLYLVPIRLEGNCEYLPQ